MKTKFIFLLIISLLIITACSPRQFLVWYIDTNTDSDLKNSFDGDMALYKDILICVRSNKMIAFNKDTGEKLWVHRSLNGMDYQRTPIILKEKIFNVTIDTVVLTVLNLGGGVIYEEEFSEYQGNLVPSIPIYDESKKDKIYTVLYKSGDVVVSIDSETYEIEDILHIPPHQGKLHLRDNILFIPYYLNSPPNDKSGIIAYNVVTEEQKWKTSFGTLDGIQCYTPIEYNGKLYVTVDDKTKELDMETGKVLRTFEGQGFYGMSVGDNVLLLPDWLYGYDLNSGKLKWVVEANYSLGSGSVFHNGLFYLMNYGLMVIEAETGNKALSHTFNHSYSEPVWQRDSTSRMPLLDEQAGVIYINGIRGIYAFRTVR